MGTKPVVVGVDGSTESLLAAEWAAMQAARHGLALHIVSAPGTVPRLHSSHASPATLAGELRDLSVRALGLADARAGEVAPGLKVTTAMLSGAPALAVAGSGAGAAMLVLGARGTGGFAAMVLGSVSRYAADRATCPVIVVRRESMAVHHEIAVGIRDPEDADGALTFAFEEASARHAELVVVHAWYWFTSPLGGRVDPEIAGTDPELVSAEAGRRLAASLAGWRQKYPDVPVRQDVAHGHPARVLADCSSRTDLVVIGKHGGPSIGSIRHALLNHARGPVAIVPSGRS
jgi:nucleotide-binding universal stress UspA family protein